MSDLIEPLFVLRTGRPISSSPLLVDANDDGWPEVFVGGNRFYGLTWKGDYLPRWPQNARRPFASSAAYGDVNGDGRGELVIGCDDGGVHAYHVDGTSVKGWPFRADRDVFSTPALADLDSDGALEVIVGSDDGTLYALNGEGTPLWQRGLSEKPYISASPTVVDLNGDGTPEIAVGAWDHVLHVWSARGRPYAHPMQDSGSVIWSSATAFQLEGEGMHLVWASDRVHVASREGMTAPGWPNATESWMASSPALVNFAPDLASIVVGSERLYAWDLLGRSLPGWPVDLGDYVWGSPIALDVDGDGFREVIVGGWDGGLHAIRHDGRPVQGFPLMTEGPVFSSPAATPLPDGGGLLVAASWDGTIRGWRLPDARFQSGDWPQFRGSPVRTGFYETPIARGTGSTPPRSNVSPSEALILGTWTEEWFGGVKRVVVDGSNLSNSKRLMVYYQIPGEKAPHISPVMKSGSQFVALIQPLRTPHRVRFWVVLERPDGAVQRWPPQGAQITLQLPSAVEGLMRKVKDSWGRTSEIHSDRRDV